MSTELSPDASAELADPDTSPERLQQLAARHPGLGPRIAEHPNCYPELRQWISQQRPGAQEPGRRRRALKILGIAAAIALPLITAVTVTITVLANLNERESSAESLNILADPVDALADAEVIGEWSDAQAQNYGSHGEHRTFWRLSLEAPIETFPTNQVPNEYGFTVDCTPEQLAWLEEHSTAEGLIRDSFSLTVHNDATTGGALPLGNIRFLGSEIDSQPSVYFMCPPPQVGAVGSGQPFVLGVDGGEALYGEPLYMEEGEQAMPVGSPVSLNLSPGEVQVLTLSRADSIDDQRSYTGDIVADVQGGSGETVVLAEGVLFDRANLPGFKIESSGMDNSFKCLSPTFFGIGISGDPEPKPCTLAEAAGVLREAAASVEE